MKKDIITITGLTSEDGSVLTAGAHIAVEMEIRSNFNGYAARAVVYRNKQIFENGYAPVRIKDFEEELVIETTDDFTVSSVYTEMVNFINNQYDSPVCEIVNQ